MIVLYCTYFRRPGFFEFMRSVAILTTYVPIQPVPLLLFSSPLSAIPAFYGGQFARTFPPNPASEFPLAIIPVHIPPRPFLFSCLYRLPGAVNEPNHYPCVLGRVQCPPKNKVYPGPLGLIPNASRKQTDNAGPAKLRHQGI